MSIIKLINFHLILFNAFFLIKAQDKNLIIETSNGQILGIKRSTVISQTTYYAYRGIPYAEPPIGELRFKAPIPAKNWTGVLNATVDKSMCVQDVAKGSEDCLFINVYTPKIDPNHLLPAMVWIHGGGFLEGDSQYETFGPDYLLEQNVVVATLNYRLGIFGFFSTGDLAASGNWGIKDQALALAWVQDNIRNFGGDPDRVTIFGESAGSASISYLLQAPLKKKLFHAAIMQSGTSLDLWALSRHPKATAFDLGVRLGIFTGNSTYLVRRLGEIDAYTLNGVANAVDLIETAVTNPRDGLIFGPCEEVEHEDAIILPKSHERLKNGGFAKVPVIVGFNSQEGIPFVQLLERVKFYLISYDVAPVRLIPADMNVQPWNKPVVAIKIRTHYFGLGSVVFNNDRLLQFVTDDQFVRPINEAVGWMSKYTTVFYYKFSYMGALGLDPGKPPRTGPGVGHEEDLHYLWRKKNNIPNPSETDILTGSRMVKLWTNFAKTLDPTPQREGLLQNVTWNAATKETRRFLDIGDNLDMESDLSLYNIEWWRQLYEDYGNPPYDTY